MFDRFVSLLLIAAVIACPMWCDSGVCQCCAPVGWSAEGDSPKSCSLNEAACCCERSEQDKERDVPRPCPDTSNCQGVCGGAVIEKPCELDEADASFLPLLMITDESIVSLQLQIRAVAVEHHCCPGTKNYGRFVRTLHSSFLC